VKFLSLVVQNYGSYYGRHEIPLAGLGLVLVLGHNADESRMNSNGCLSGGTLIDCPRDVQKFPKGIPIQDLVGTQPWVYAWRDGQITVCQATRVWRTKVAETIRVRVTPYATKAGAGQGKVFIPPQELVGTPDHLVLLSDGCTWRALGALKPGDSLCSLYRRKSGGWRTLLYWTGSGLMSMGKRLGPRTVSEQQFVCSTVYGARPEGSVVHHKDDNQWNHSVENLEWKDGHQHLSEHTSERNRLGRAGWQARGVHPRGMAGKRHTPEIRAQISSTLRESWKNRRQQVNHTVLNVESAGVQEVFDMEVPEIHNFVANGIVVHNSGKSTPWEAFDWCLWGVIPRADHVDSIINEEAGKDCMVGVRFEDDQGRLVQVERFRKLKDSLDGKETGMRLTVAGENQTSLDVAETQRKLEIILGLDREVFHAAILFGQNDSWRFADGTDAERIDVLTRVLQLGEIDGWLEKAKSLMAGSVTERNQYNQTLVQRQAELASFQAMDFKKQIDEWEAGRRDHLAKLDARVAEVQGNAQVLRDRAGDETPLMNQWRILEASTPLTPAGLDDRAEASAETKIGALLIAAQRQLDEWSKRILTIRTHWTGTCPECGQVVPKEHVDREVVRLTQEVTIGEQGIAHLRLERDRIVARREVVRREFDAQMILYRQSVEKHAADKGVVQKRLWESQQFRKQALEADALVERYRQDRQGIEAQFNPFEAKQSEVQKGMDTIRTNILELEGRVNGVNERARILEFWVDAFGPKGLKNYILDTRLQEMTDAVNQWVKLLTGGTFWVRFETQTMGRSTGRLANKLNIRVFQYGKDGRIVERNYKSWSGGQKARVSMGVDFGLARLLAARARQRYDLLILDEVFKHLDRAGREAVVEMLHTLRLEKSSLIVIDHDAEFGSAFENVMQVELKNRRSTIREVRGAAKQAAEVQHDGSRTGAPLPPRQPQTAVS